MTLPKHFQQQQIKINFVNCIFLLSVDRFPFGRPHILEKWKLATSVQEPKLLRVCSLHFTPDSFNENGHLLKRAVPTKHLSAAPKAAAPKAAEPIAAAAPKAAEPIAAEPVAAEPVAAESVAAMPVAAELVAAAPIAEEPLAPDDTHLHHQTLKRSSEPINHHPSPKRQHLCVISTNITGNHDKSTRSIGVQAGHTVEQIRKKEYQNEKRLNRLKVQVHRQKKKLGTLGDELANLKKQKLLTDDAYELINCKFGEISLEIFQNELKNSEESSKQRRYSDTIKQFAVTLHFYSPQAYNFVREHLHLPHPRSISEWVSSVDCHPGMIDAVFLHLQKRLEKDPCMADCCLIFDAMAIKKDATPNAATKSYECFENYGGIAEEPGENVAKEALVLMVASITGVLEIPYCLLFYK